MTSIFIELNIKPAQISKYLRHIVTDNGEGTTLQIERTETTICLRIVQYNSAGVEQKRSADFRLNAEHIKTAASMDFIDDTFQWKFISADKVELHITKRPDGDVLLWVIDPTKHQSVFHAPQFSQVASGGRSKAFRMAILQFALILKRASSDIEKSKSVICYAQLEELYHAIADEPNFTMDC